MFYKDSKNTWTYQEYDGGGLMPLSFVVSCTPEEANSHWLDLIARA